MLLRQIFDPALAQYAYLIGCQKTGEALLIDPERDIDRYLRLAEENDLRVTAVAETHIHADFVSGARELAQAVTGLKLYLSEEGGKDWTYQWPGKDHQVRLLKHGDAFSVGGIRVEAVHTPGHTPEHLSFLITDNGGGADQPIALATGDFLFAGDVGRPDLLETAAGASGVMEPSARQLRESLVSRLRDQEDFLQILPGHGAGSACGKSLGAIPTTTLGYERRFNSSLKGAEKDGAQFVRDILTGQPEPPLYFARMKKVNRDGIEVTGGHRLPPKQSSGQAAEFARSGKGRVLDLRTDRQAFANQHLKGAIHAPFGTSFFLTAAGSYLTEEEPILLVLETSEDLDEAVRQLYRIGLDRVAGWTTMEDLLSEPQEWASLPRVMFENFDPSSAGRDGLIIDVRSTVEFEAGHIEGAVSYPYTRLREKLESLPRDKPLFVHCGTGRRAGLAASFLQAEGFRATLVDGVCATCEEIAATRGITN